MENTSNFAHPGWKWCNRVLLRTFIVYAAVTVIPLVPSFYSQDFDAGFSVANYPWRWLDVISQNNPGSSAVRVVKTMLAGLSLC